MLCYLYAYFGCFLNVISCLALARNVPEGGEEEGQ